MKHYISKHKFIDLNRYYKISLSVSLTFKNVFEWCLFAPGFKQENVFLSPSNCNCYKYFLYSYWMLLVFFYIIVLKITFTGCDKWGYICMYLNHTYLLEPWILTLIIIIIITIIIRTLWYQSFYFNSKIEFIL